MNPILKETTKNVIINTINTLKLDLNTQHKQLDKMKLK